MTRQGGAIPKCLVTLVTEVCPVALDILRIIIAVFFLKSIHVYKFTFSSRKCKITMSLSHSRTLDLLFGSCFLSHFWLLALGDCS